MWANRTVRQEVSKQRTMRQEVSKQRTVSQEVNTQNTVRQDISKQKTVRQEVSEQRVVRQEVSKQRTVRQEVSKHSQLHISELIDDKCQSLSRVSCALEAKIDWGPDMFHLRDCLREVREGRLLTLRVSIVPCKYSCCKKWLLLLKLCSCSYEVQSVYVWFPLLSMRESHFRSASIESLFHFLLAPVSIRAASFYIYYISDCCWLVQLSQRMGLDWVEGYTPGLGPGSRLSWDRC